MKLVKYGLERMPAMMLGMAIAFLLKTDAPYDLWYYFAWLITAAWAVFVLGGSEWLDQLMDKMIKWICNSKGEP